MTHWPKTLSDVIYRTVLLRRLTLTCTLIVCAGLAVAAAVHGDVVAWSDPQAFAVSAAIGLGLIVLHGVLFPAGVIDALGFALTAALWLVAVPAILPFMTDQNGFMVVLLLAVGPVLTACVVVWLIAVGHGVWQLGSTRVRAEHQLPVPAGAVIAQEFVRPETDLPRRRTGRVDANGFFPVWCNYRFPTRKTGYTVPNDAEMSAAPPDYHVRIIEQGPGLQVSQFAMPRLEEGAVVIAGGSIICHQTVTAEGPDACRYIVEEVHDAHSLLMSVMAWLADMARDHEREMIDDLLDRPGPSVEHLPKVTVMSLILRAVFEAGLTGGPDEDGRPI